MDWIVVAVLGYFLLAIVAALEKYLLHSRISKPSVFAFYVSVFSLFVLGFIPFVDFAFVNFSFLLLHLISGVFFIYGLIALYKAVQKNEVSRVIPVVGIAIPIFSAVLSIFLLGESFTVYSLWAFFLLIIGGFLISFDLPITNLKIFKGFSYAVLAGALHSASFVTFKLALSYDGDFPNSFIWNRIAYFIAGMSILLIPVFRGNIVKSFEGIKVKKTRKKTAKTTIIFIANKVMAGIAALLLSYAFSLGPVASVNSLVSVQFVFVFGLATYLSFRYHEIYREKMELNDWIQKIVSILIIAVGLFMFYL